MHIQTLRGRILETILSLRFFMFQYGIVYKLHLTGKDTSLAVNFLLFLHALDIRLIMLVLTPYSLTQHSLQNFLLLFFWGTDYIIIM